MFTPEEEVTTKRRYEFRVESPYYANVHATLRDVTDSISVALARLKSIKGDKAADYDDALHAYATDEHVVFYFDVEE